MPRKKSSKENKKDKKTKAKKSLLCSETKRSIAVVTFFALALLSIFSFFDAAGLFGQNFMELSRLLFGKGYFFVSISLALGGFALLAPRLGSQKYVKSSYKTVIVGLLLFLISILGIFYLFGVRGIIDSLSLDSGSLPGEVHLIGIRTGGYLGVICGFILAKYFGFWAGLVVLCALLVISILISFNIPLVPRKPEEVEEQGKSNIEKKIDNIPTGTEENHGIWNKIKEKAKQGIQNSTLTNSKDDLKESSSPNSRKDEAVFQPSKNFTKLASDFKLPPLDFLEAEQGKPTSGDVKANINIIKRTLENFGIEVEMGDVNIGPTVTQYTLRPAEGVKLSRITALQNDLALALAAHPIRIEAPIPKQSLVGIEIPNKSIVVVRLKGLLENIGPEQMSKGLTFALGKNVAGGPVLADLCKMPHMLVAGATGTGKTVALNNILISLLYYNTPENLKLILVDPKRVELTAYENIPHLMTPVIVTPDKAVGALKWTVGEMERRFEVLQYAKKRDIASYNSSLSPKNKTDHDLEYLPYIVVVIDELADLMSSHGREAEAGIVRLSQMARAVGIHLLVSTQRPSVEVITGLIKANITSRIALQVASQIDSRTILDMAGAEKLLGNGDMLFLSANSAKPFRVQGAYIADKEVKKVTDYWRTLAQPDYEDRISNPRPTISSGVSVIGGGDDSDTGDELYEDAKNLVIESKKASASLLQRRLRVGYARAARLLDILEDKGIVGPSDGAKAREVFLDDGNKDNSENTENTDVNNIEV